MKLGIADGQPLALNGESRKAREESPVSIGQHAG